MTIRILFVTPFYYPEFRFGGPPKRLHSLAKGLRDRGNDVEVVTFNSQNALGGETAVFDDIQVHYVPWKGRSSREVPVTLNELTKGVSRVDVVHCYGLYNLLCPAGAFLATQKRKPFLLEPMGMFVPRNRSRSIKRFYNWTATEWMARKAAAVVATSKLEAIELQPLAKETELVVRRNGIDVDQFLVLPPRNIMRDRWHVKKGDKLILFLGRISAKKRIAELLHAFRMAAIPGARLVIAGPVSEPDYLLVLERIVADGLSDRVSIVEALYQEDLLAAFSASDLFVLPSENENFGNAAGEAVAAGVPVLLTETCGIASLIHRRAGLAVPLGAQSLIDGLRLMLDPQGRNEFLNAPEAVKRDLSWREPIAETIELYHRVIRENAEKLKRFPRGRL